MLTVSKYYGEGCVLQQGRPVKVSGTAAAGGSVMVEVQGQNATAVADAAGRWTAILPALTPGGPFALTVSDDAGDKLCNNAYVGEVWMCAGQSNMELPMARVKDRYPDEMTAPANPLVRTFKITEDYVLDAPLADPKTGEWTEASPETIADFSATAYFFGKALSAARGVPVGLINTSKGGSRIEAWMPRTALADYPALLEETDRCCALTPERFLAQEEGTAAAWQKALAEKEKETGEWKPIRVPGWLSAVPELDKFTGSLLLRTHFTVPAQMLEQNKTEAVRLWLGTMVDSDRTYINGVQVGETGYQYPPRKYDVPAGLLKEGENELLVHLVCQSGTGRLTPGKDYCLFTDTLRVELAGMWEYSVLARCEAAPLMDFLCRKATGLYNGLIAPCTAVTVAGALWYQGESNDFRPGDYADLLKKMIASWRAAWGVEKPEEMPFVIAQLPDFAIDLDPKTSGWPEIREAQRHAALLPAVAVTVNLDLGEDNDLHPLNKEGVGNRAALAARRLAYGEDIPASGPMPVRIQMTGRQARLDFSTVGELRTMDGLPADEFELAGEDGVFYPAQATLQGNAAVLSSAGVDAPTQVRYAWSNAPRRGLLTDETQLPMGPFWVKNS